VTVVADAKVAERAVNVGDRMPVFRLPAISGEVVDAGRLLDRGPLVISFYRGGWCPYCNIELRALQGTLPDKIRLRKTKLGFSTPEPEWVRQGLQNGHREEWDTATPRMGRFISTPALSAECDKFLRGAPHALPANWLFRAIELELWAGVHGVS